MVTITKRGRKLMVTKGAFKEFFAKDGWLEEGEPKIADFANETETDDETTPEADDDQTNGKENDADEDDSEIDSGADSDEAAEEDDEEDDITEKPLSEMTKKELRAYADLNNINLDDVADRRDDLIEAIKASMQE
jgi:hypothetical protein